MFEADIEPRMFVEPPAQPPSTRNLAFTLPPKVSVESVLAVIRSSAPSWLHDVQIVDLFKHEVDGTQVRTLTFEIQWSNENFTRTTDDLNTETNALINVVENSFTGKGVTLR